MRKIVKNVPNCATSALGAKHINELVFISVMQSANIALELARQLDIYLYIAQYMYLFYFALERQHYGGAVGIARIVDQRLRSGVGKSGFWPTYISSGHNSPLKST